LLISDKFIGLKYTIIEAGSQFGRAVSSQLSAVSLQ